MNAERAKKENNVNLDIKQVCRRRHHRHRHLLPMPYPGDTYISTLLCEKAWSFSPIENAAGMLTRE